MGSAVLATASHGGHRSPRVATPGRQGLRSPSAESRGSDPAFRHWSRPPRLLLVEDESVVAIDLGMRLERLGCHLVGIADDRASAMAAFERDIPDLVLLDIRLRDGEDGIDLADEMQRLQPVPIVFISGFDDSATLARAARKAPRGFLTKPVDDRTLRATLSMALERGPDEDIAAVLGPVLDAVALPMALLVPSGRRLTAEYANASLRDELRQVGVAARDAGDWLSGQMRASDLEGFLDATAGGVRFECDLVPGDEVASSVHVRMVAVPVARKQGPSKWLAVLFARGPSSAASHSLVDVYEGDMFRVAADAVLHELSLVGIANSYIRHAQDSAAIAELCDVIARGLDASQSLARTISLSASVPTPRPSRVDVVGELSRALADEGQVLGLGIHATVDRAKDDLSTALTVEGARAVITSVGSILLRSAGAGGRVAIAAYLSPGARAAMPDVVRIVATARPASVDDQSAVARVMANPAESQDGWLRRLEQAVGYSGGRMAMADVAGTLERSLVIDLPAAVPLIPHPGPTREPAPTRIGGCVLVGSDDVALLAYAAALEALGFSCMLARDAMSALGALSEHGGRAVAIVVDAGVHPFPGSAGMLAEVAARFPGVSRFIVTGNPDVRTHDGVARLPFTQLPEALAVEVANVVIGAAAVSASAVGAVVARESRSVTTAPERTAVRRAGGAPLPAAADVLLFCGDSDLAAVIADAVAKVRLPVRLCPLTGSPLLASGLAAACRIVVASGHDVRALDLIRELAASTEGGDVVAVADDDAWAERARAAGALAVLRRADAAHGIAHLALASVLRRAPSPRHAPPVDGETKDPTNAVPSPPGFRAALEGLQAEFHPIVELRTRRLVAFDVAFSPAGQARDFAELRALAERLGQVDQLERAMARLLAPALARDPLGERPLLVPSLGHDLGVATGRVLCDLGGHVLLKHPVASTIFGQEGLLLGSSMQTCPQVETLDDAVRVGVTTRGLRYVALLPPFVALLRGNQDARTALEILLGNCRAQRAHVVALGLRDEADARLFARLGGGLVCRVRTEPPGP